MITFKQLIENINHQNALSNSRISLGHSAIREQYLNGDIFRQYDVVRTGSSNISIITKCGANHLLLQNESGKVNSVWLNDVTPINESTLLEQDKMQIVKIIASILNVKNLKESNSTEAMNFVLMSLSASPILENLLQTAIKYRIKFDHNLVSEDIDTADKKFITWPIRKPDGTVAFKGLHYRKGKVTFRASGDHGVPIDSKKLDSTRDDKETDNTDNIDPKLGKIYDKTRIKKQPPIG
jgi:hypothetical protein